MRSILNYIGQNALELLFVLSASALIYSLVRRFGFNFLIALTFAGFPVLTIWAYRNALMGGVMMGFF